MSAFAERVLANVREEIRSEVAYALELAGEPELLEALKAVQLAFTLAHLAQGVDPAGSESLRQAAAAIAKATQP